MKEFVHLHNHTEYSLLDGIARIPKLIEIEKERGSRAVAITDHGNMYGTLSFYEECIKKQIKPILGCEFYICNDLTKKQGKEDMGHLILLAKNNVGFHNLLKLNEIAFCEGFYYKPRIDYKVLEKHSEGVICLSACLAGHIPQYILQRRFDEAEALILKMKDMFEPGDFYLEIQNHGIPEQKVVNVFLAEMSKKHNIKMVATNDVHYLNKEDSEMQDILMCVQMGKFLDDPDRMKFSTDEFYLKNYDEMKEAMQGFEEALETTLEIADKCEVVLKTKSLGEIYEVDKKYKLASSENFIPVYQPSTNETPYDFLKRITYEGLYKNYTEVTQNLIDRLEMELNIISKQGFVEYFLIVWDYINYAESQKIPVGPGRGSGAGSLVAYCTGITKIDPIKHDLLFERFINTERVSMPDFDVDFCMDRRNEVVEYVKRRYGEDHVANIGVFGTMQAKNALRDVARVLRYPNAEVMKITKLIPGKLPDGIKRPPVLKYYFGTTGKPENEKFIITELRELYDNDESVKKIADLAIKLEGVPRNVGTHACGVLISPEAVSNYVPVAVSEGQRVTQYTMIELEHLGLLKMDFLGLRTLTDIKKACDYIFENHGVSIDFYDKSMTYDDPKVFELISSGNTDAIFQIESAGFKKFMKDLKPTCLDDIIAGVSLYRPGPMDFIPMFVKNKQNPEGIVYDDPCLEPVLDVTYGCIVYQEQVMRIVQDMAGYSLGQADQIRRIMGKKQVEKIELEREKFINGWKDPNGKKDIPGAVNLGHDRKIAEKIFNEMKEFAKYAFNKSHAAAYSYLTYQTAYLKCYYEVEFITAILNNRINNADDLTKYISFARGENIDVLPPNINKSMSYFHVENQAIRFGLGGLKHVGTSVTDSIIEERKNGLFESFEDFINRAVKIGVNKKAIECLILAGAFDEFGKTRSQYMAVYENIVERAVKDKKSNLLGQMSLFELNDIEDKIDYPNLPEFNKKTLLKYEKEIIGVYMSGHPLEDHIKKFEEFNLTSDMLSDIVQDEVEDEVNGNTDYFSEDALKDGQSVTCGGIITEVSRKRTKTGKEMCYIKLEDLKGVLEIMFFSNSFTRYRNIIEVDNLVTIKGRISIRDGMPTTVIGEVVLLWKDKEEIEQKNNKNRLCLKFNTKNPDLYCKVKNSILSYPGETSVMIKCSLSNKAFVYQRKVKINNYLLNELSGIIGSENIIVQE